jgi:hypothetical protein
MGGKSTVDKTVSQSGTFSSTNCDINANPSNGCGGYAASNSTYGDGFNAAGGGVIVLDWTATYIKIYQFTRASIPTDIAAGNPQPSGWGKPVFDFEGSGANIQSVKNHNIIFDLTYPSSDNVDVL